MRRSGNQGFTLIELLASIAILAILATITFFSYYAVLNSAGSARCISNMRTLHPAFSAYVQDNGFWPQQPEFDPNDKKGYGQWWIYTMKPYVPSDSIWICPTTQSLSRGTPEDERMLIHYIPTQFDAFRNRPYQWSSMPWLVEFGNAHRKGGGNVLFPDGSIRNFDTIRAGWQ